MPSVMAYQIGDRVKDREGRSGTVNSGENEKGYVYVLLDVGKHPRLKAAELKRIRS